MDWQINKTITECNRYILKNEVDCDVTFKVGEDQEVIKAHKFILKIRSPVFDRMFNGSFRESETDPSIPDVSPAAFRTLLKYCYYERLNIEGDIALSVHYAATKYMLPILERAARKTLIENPDSSNIWDVCQYANQVGDKKLYAGCIKYLKVNLSSSNILDIVKFAVTTGDKELHAYCRKHLKENLSETYILDVTKYMATTGDEELHAMCRSYLKTHLSGSSIWEVYKYALTKGDIELHHHCREYFKGDLMLAMEALQSEEFTNIQYEVLLDVLSINDEGDKVVGVRESSGISLSEIELFKACNAWAEAECLRQNIELSGANKRTVLGECLILIRFPTMLLKDLVTWVYPTGLLTQAEIASLGLYMHQHPGSECQVHFPSDKRLFNVTPSGPASFAYVSTVYIESVVRVMLHRLWTGSAGGYRVTVKDERSQRSWSMVLDTKHQNHVQANSNKTLHYIDVDPQVLEAGARYSVTTERVRQDADIKKQPGVEYITVPQKLDPYKEVKITRAPNTSAHILILTLTLI